VEIKSRGIFLKYSHRRQDRQRYKAGWVALFHQIFTWPCRFWHSLSVIVESEDDNMPNPFVHVELNTQDVDKSKNFYGQLFDWKLEDVPMGDGTDYTMIRVGTGTSGGMLKNPMPGAPSMWLAYVIVDDIAAATARAKSLGATILRDVTEAMGMGWLSIIMDPTGAVLGLWQAKPGAQ
jgi:hypothetical protein